jgi:putative ABC transport system permease protein
MFINHLKTAWRNSIRNKSYSIINIAGLAVGLSCFIVILLHLNYELSYDTWDTSLKKVYKISMRTDDDFMDQTPPPLRDFLKQHSPDIEASATIADAGDFEVLISTEDKKIYQTGSVEANSSFFEIFPYKIIQGDARTPLDKPGAMVVSKEVAQKLFGNADPVGKKVKVFNLVDCEVTAVMETPGKPSHLNTQFVWRSPFEKQNADNWHNYSYHTYIKTKKIIPVEKLENDINRFYYDQRLKTDNRSLAEFRKAGHQAGLFADAVKQLHNFPKHGNSNFKTVSVLLVLAVLLLIAGAINFSNLSIAASMRRAKEIGVRKVLGSDRRQLFWQFMVEIALQCFISLALAIVLVNSLLPYFNQQFGLNLSFGAGNAISIFLQIAICLLAVILLSGLYPAVFLSYFKTINVLKGDYSRGTRGMRFRNSLIVAQFTVSAFFIIGTLVISRQMHYMQTKDKGFSGEQVMRIQASQKLREKDFETTKSRLLTIPGVQYVSKTTSVPGDAQTDTSTITYKYEGKEHRMSSVKVSADYFNTLNIKLLSGRLLNESYADQHTRNAVINKSAAQKLNIGNKTGGTLYFADCDPMQIIGIVNDFNVGGMESNVQPAVYTIGNSSCMFQSGGGLLVKLNSDHMQQSIAAIEQEWKKIDPATPIRYAFLDENFQKLLTSYTLLQKVINAFAFIAICISVMGLFALTAFLTGQRTKEIGIRKVLGAGIGDLASLLSKDFIRLIAMAVVISVPLGWWACDKWLQSFAYRINISWWMFLIAALIVVAIAIVTVSIQTLKAARANPVKSLRSE